MRNTSLADVLINASPGNDRLSASHCGTGKCFVSLDGTRVDIKTALLGKLTIIHLVDIPLAHF